MKNENKNSHKRHFTSTDLICVLLVIALVFLGLAEYANLHRDEIGKKIAEDLASSSVSTSSASASSLPTELTSTSSNLILVNKTHKLPDGYEPTDAELSTPYLNSSTDAIRLKSEAAEQAKAMKAAAAEASITLIVSSGYITYKEQEDLYNTRVKLLGGGDNGPASTAIEKPGYSEHQTGLAIDFTNDAAQSTPTSAFADTDAGKWLYAHAHEYGFILRYPKGKESITGYDYMPWHYRYVGVDAANAIYAVSPDETFEEYYKISN
ncbi:MAG: M15 family metallopeptidase [Solobacterium sp.]|nr:M15 family metallopeptidase [Solobacterium sp.]MCH4205400.1 M15 family metallopeptidase [Solobacterium sp.]MCH4226612.1 M15 family metallopeptidase [Solobacterium sp.]MCH4282087.1 M15 family metallopeptidase [Solobacterium sp.]